MLRFPIDPSDCCVAVCDDGIGMNKNELLDAMKYGSQLKSANRSEDDLGRFGLGMKAASLSQCRRLTVASKKDGKLSSYIWDLDIIEEKKDWYMVDCSKEQIAEIRYVDFLNDKESGTIVLWENFDFYREVERKCLRRTRKAPECNDGLLILDLSPVPKWRGAKPTDDHGEQLQAGRTGPFP